VRAERSAPRPARELRDAPPVPRDCGDLPARRIGGLDLIRAHESGRPREYRSDPYVFPVTLIGKALTRKAVLAEFVPKK
ncbi:MAG: hypothetical protein ABIZ80_09385, partial [Bryobacteraceae bacterium]